MTHRRLAILAVFIFACSAFPPFILETEGGTKGAAKRGQSIAAIKSPAVVPEIAEPTPSQFAANSAGFEIRIHPEDGIYVGELVSFEILAPEGAALDNQEIEIQVNAPVGLVLGPLQFRPFGIGGRAQATFLWEWDTSSFEAGEYDLTFNILPDGESWTEVVTLLSPESMPDDSANADWAQVKTDCCIVYYMTNTETERDITLLTSQIDEQAELAEKAMDSEIEGAIPFVLMPRLLGHGGFASSEIYISYLDRNYAGESTSQVFHHEIIHVLDARLGGDLRPSMLVEGLAVYLSGGHFKIEPLIPRAVALLDLDWYIPFETLADDFYFQQHEIGYIQASALTEYMVVRWGWDAYNKFYRDLHSHASGSAYQAIDAGLRRHFEISFAELEAEFLEALRAQPLDQEMVADVRLTVHFFDSVRRYQQALDPSAYFLTAWLLDIDEMQAFDVTADYLRHPDEATNLALETMLVSADHSLRSGRYGEAERLLNAVNAVLDAFEHGEAQPFEVHPLASHYYRLVQALQASGYEPHEISIIRNTAEVLASQNGVELVTLTMSLDGESWTFD